MSAFRRLTCSLEIWQQKNNAMRQSGTLRKRRKLQGERERLRICRKERVRLSAKKEPRLRERNETAEDTVQVRRSSLLTQCLCDYQRLTSGRLFFHPCGNLMYFVFCRDLRRLFSGHPYLIYLLSPTRGFPLLCCLRRAFYKPSRCHGLSAFAWTCTSFCFLVP